MKSLKNHPFRLVITLMVIVILMIVFYLVLTLLLPYFYEDVSREGNLPLKK